MSTTRTQFTFRVDTWTPDGESIVGWFWESVAGITDRADTQGNVGNYDERIKPAEAVRGSLHACRPLPALLRSHAKKLRLIKISVDTQIKDREKNKKAHDLCSDIYKANDNRTTVAHSDFDPAPGGGVQFGKTVTKDGRVLPVGPLWPAEQFHACYEEMSSLETRLGDLIRVIEPAPVPDVTLWMSPLSEPVRVETGLGKVSQSWRFNPRK